jgi:plasmid maintenance system killer protein
MEITFASTRLEKECNQEKLLIRRYGPVQAKLIRRRLDEIRAADSLEILGKLPQARCHELKADRAGQISVDLKHPYRLLFEPAHHPIPHKPDGGLDWAKVTSIRILEVEDTHG